MMPHECPRRNPEQRYQFCLRGNPQHVAPMLKVAMSNLLRAADYSDREDAGPPSHHVYLNVTVTSTERSDHLHWAQSMNCSDLVLLTRYLYRAHREVTAVTAAANDGYLPQLQCWDVPPLFSLAYGGYMTRSEALREVDADLLRLTTSAGTREA